MNRRRFIAAALASAAVGAPVAAEPLSELPHGRWIKLHEQAADAVRFQRQAHACAAFDTKRSRLVLFGSDTHGEDWKNSPFFFDPAVRAWSRLYPDDDPATYRVDRDGIPVAGIDGNHPWAMHTMGAIAYHADRDALIVSSYPQHLEPGRFTDAMAHVWPAIRRHPTWLLDMGSGTWTALAAEPEHFFPYATAYDPERQVVIGYKAAGVYELGGEPLRWKKILGPGLFGYHDNAAFDTRRHALVVFGTNTNSNDVVTYEPATRRHRRMPTPGLRPPPGQARPMAFHAGIGRTVVLCDRPGRSETWLYDLGRDAWTRHEATLPFPLGMNFNLVFDPGHELLLLVTGGPDRATAVWALRA
jgi:hypothetical protein